MKTITLKLTSGERDIIEKELKTTKPHYKNDITGNATYVGVRTFSHHNKIVTINNVDKFREFLNDEIDKIYQSDLYNYGHRNCAYEFKVDENKMFKKLDNLKSILSKLDKAVVLNNLQKQITKVEEIDKDFCDMIAEGCSPDESEGQFYNGVRIDEDTILVLSTYFDSMSNSEDYFHYSISKDKLVPVDAEMDEKYRELFEECNMLDYTDCFFIMGVEPIAIGDSDLLYGDDYNDTIVNLDVVQNDEPKTKEYEIEYTLSTGDWNHGRYFGKNKEEAKSNFTKWSCRPKSSITSIVEIVDNAVQNDEPKDDSEDYTGVCPECGCDDLDGGSGCDMDTQNLECSNGHSFTIQSKGWEIV